MRFNDHSHLEGSHAFLSASKYHWIRYDVEKLERVWKASREAARGTRLHELAHDLIRLGVKLPEEPVTTLGLYVNDCIGWRMYTEVMLAFSENAYGTADAIRFDDRALILRISDLKNGITEASPEQLEVYAALFCLEYQWKPFDLSEIQLRIYQNREVRLLIADPDKITHIMDRLTTFNRHIEEWKRGE